MNFALLKDINHLKRKQWLRLHKLRQPIQSEKRRRLPAYIQDIIELRIIYR